jgi:hypothetical protein
MKRNNINLYIILLFISLSTTYSQKLPKIFWVSDGGFGSKIQSANYDGSEMTDIITNLSTARALAIDTVATPKQIYFSQSGTTAETKGIFKANIDGSELIHLQFGLGGVTDIELDIVNRKMYWSLATYGYDMIASAHMDFPYAMIDTLHYSTTLGIDFGGIGMDFNNGMIYWTESNNGGLDKIMRMTKYGTNKQLILNNSNIFLSAPRDIDVASDTLYWTDSGVFAHWTMKSNLDGSNLDTVLTDISSYSFWVNDETREIFWTEQMGLYSAHLDSTNKILLFSSNFGYGYAIAVCYDSSLITSVEDEETLPSTFHLEQNYPNPFNPSTRIQYQVSGITHVTLKIYDILGNEIAALVNEEQPAGRYEVEFSATGGPESGIRNLASGVYFCRLQSESYSKTIKMLYIK